MSSVAPTPELLARAAQVRLAIFDVDGVLTDGRLYFAPDGVESKTFHSRDGLGLKLLRQSTVEVGIISGRSSPIVDQRMRTLGIDHVYQGIEDKLVAFEELLRKLNLKPEQTASVGDDLPDLPLARRAGLSIAVADAHPALLPHVHWITTRPGGAGAAREVCDLIMEAQGTLAPTIDAYP